MHNHSPANYICPLCLAINGIENDKTMMKQNDIILKDDLAMIAINSKFVPKNPGHVIVVPIKHYENIYDIPELELSHIMKLAKKVAIAIKEVRKCDGIMLSQNNEPASDQHAFHFHLHVYPRFDGDNIHSNLLNAIVSTPEERIVFASQLKTYFND